MIKMCNYNGVDKGFNKIAIKDPHVYAVQGSDTTMLPIAASLPGQ